jgi:hypothetical protein
MVYKIATYILLLNFVNTMFFHELSMLAPHRTSPYDLQARETDEVNTLVEFILEYCLGIPGDTPEEDFDDNPDHIFTSLDFVVPVYPFSMISWRLVPSEIRWSFNFLFPHTCLKVASPPPEYRTA